MARLPFSKYIRVTRWRTELRNLESRLSSATNCNYPFEETIGLLSIFMYVIMAGNPLTPCVNAGRQIMGSGRTTVRKILQMSQDGKIRAP